MFREEEGFRQPAERVLAAMTVVVTLKSGWSFDASVAEEPYRVASIERPSIW